MGGVDPLCWDITFSWKFEWHDGDILAIKMLYISYFHYSNWHTVGNVSLMGICEAILTHADDLVDCLAFCSLLNWRKGMGGGVQSCIVSKDCSNRDFVGTIHAWLQISYWLICSMIDCKMSVASWCLPRIWLLLFIIHKFLNVRLKLII